MNIQLGIFQDQERMNQYLAARGIGHSDIQVAGPFPSRLQAVQWMDFIEKRLGQGKMERHAVGLMNQHPWYGLSFVSSKKEIINKRDKPVSQVLAVAMG